MEWLFHVGRGLANEQPLLSRVARHAGKGIPPTYEDRVSYLLAKYEFERGRALLDAGRAADAKAAFGEARRLAAKVRPEPTRTTEAPATKEAAATKDGPPAAGGRDVFARARFVDGLVLYAQADYEGATEAFKDVVRLTNPRRVEGADQELREVAFLQLARIHYQHRQNRYAIFYYGKMPWGGERWLEGLWEASYAHYRIGDYEKTLGNLLTLQSPYFGDEYFPESYVLKAIVYYENCRYPEARQVLEQFSRIYDPVYEELVRNTAGRRTPDGDWELVRDAGRRPGAARKIAKVALSDQDVRRLAESIAEMEREADVGLGRRRPEFRDSPGSAPGGRGRRGDRRSRPSSSHGQRRRHGEHLKDGDAAEHRPVEAVVEEAAEEERREGEPDVEARVDEPVDAAERVRPRVRQGRPADEHVA
jgi:tetratricopeptide (TPR) repeat protein